MDAKERAETIKTILQMASDPNIKYWHADPEGHRERLLDLAREFAKGGDSPELEASFDVARGQAEEGATSPALPPQEQLNASMDRWVEHARAVTAAWMHQKPDGSWELRDPNGPTESR